MNWIQAYNKLTGLFTPGYLLQGKVAQVTAENLEEVRADVRTFLKQLNEAYFTVLIALEAIGKIPEVQPTHTCVEDLKKAAEALQKSRVGYNDRTYQRDLSILDEAGKLVGGEKRNEYGDAFESCDRVAKLWAALWGIDIPAEDVPLAMELFKISREKANHKRDNLVDGAGYWRVLELVIQGRKEREEKAQISRQNSTSETAGRAVTERHVSKPYTFENPFGVDSRPIEPTEPSDRQPVQCSTNVNPFSSSGPSQS